MKKKITFIGDVHGKINEYKKIIENCDFSICVGDFGFEPEWEHLIKYLDELQTKKNAFQSHWVNMGNHDYIPLLYSSPSTKNITHFKPESIFTVRGAESIDKHRRIEGLDWFANEELNYQEQLEAFDFYCNIKPKIVVSHDCPQKVMEQLFDYPEKSQTRTMLQNMFDEHQPELWVFGHHHKSKDVIIDGTRFVCLAELETLTIEI